MNKILFILVCGFWFLVSFADAKAVEQPLERIEAYLNDIDQLTARFEQMSSTGERATGRLWLDKTTDQPQMKLDYDAPSPLMLIGRGDTLIFVDEELMQTTYLNAEETPAGLLMKHQVDLSEEAILRDVEEVDNTLSVTMTQPDFKDTLAEVTLTFSKLPFALTSWEVVDMQGIVTHVNLIDVDATTPVNSEVFDFVRPGFFRREQSQ